MDTIVPIFIVLTQSEILMCLRIAILRYIRSSRNFGGDRHKSSTRNGIAICVQGVIGELAFYFLMGIRNFGPLLDTEPRSSSGGDEEKDACNTLSETCKVTADVKGVPDKEGKCHQIHARENTVVDPDIISASIYRRIYVLMRVCIDKGIFDAMCKDYVASNGADATTIVPLSLRVEFEGWQTLEELSKKSGGRLTDVSKMYGNPPGTTMRYQTKNLNYSWNDLVYYWNHGKVNPATIWPQRTTLAVEQQAAETAITTGAALQQIFQQALMVHKTRRAAAPAPAATTTQ